jgi:hypothetical protein
MLPKGPWWPGLLRGSLGGLRALKKENYRVTYGFTELKGKPAGRGRDGRASWNQVVAGIFNIVIFALQQRMQISPRLQSPVFGGARE